MNEESQRELVLKWADLVTEQAGDLWTVGLAFAVAQILVIASLHGLSIKARAANPIGVTSWCLLYLSTGATLLSLAFGYMVKGSVIDGISKLVAVNGDWAIPNYPGVNALLQVSSIFAGATVFLIVFGINRKAISKALMGILER